MKRFLAALAAVLLCGPAWAANSATDMYQVPIRVHGEGPVHMVKAVIDTTGQDLTLFDPAANKHACIVGLHASDGTAANITVKSGSTVIDILELTTFQQPNDVKVPVCTAQGADLIIQSSAAYANLLFMIVEAYRLEIK